MRGFHHVGVIVQNLDASADWYRHAFGFERIADLTFPHAKAAFIVRGDLRLELIQAEASSPLAIERRQLQTNLKLGGINHLAIAVDDLAKEVADLEAKGVAIALPPTDVPGTKGDRFAFVHDNEQMLVELYQAAR